MSFDSAKVLKLTEEVQPVRGAPDRWKSAMLKAAHISKHSESYLDLLDELLQYVKTNDDDAFTRRMAEVLALEHLPDDDKIELVHLLALNNMRSMLLAKPLILTLIDSQAQKLTAAGVSETDLGVKTCAFLRLLIDLLTLVAVKSFHRPLMTDEDVKRVHTAVGDLKQEEIRELLVPYFKLLAAAAAATSIPGFDPQLRTAITYRCMRIASGFLKAHSCKSVAEQWAVLESINVMKDVLPHGQIFQAATLTLLWLCCDANPVAYDNIMKWNELEWANKGSAVAFCATPHTYVDPFTELGAGSLSGKSSEETHNITRRVSLALGFLKKDARVRPSRAEMYKPVQTNASQRSARSLAKGALLEKGTQQRLQLIATAQRKKEEQDEEEEETAEGEECTVGVEIDENEKEAAALPVASSESAQRGAQEEKPTQGQGEREAENAIHAPEMTPDLKPIGSPHHHTYGKGKRNDAGAGKYKGKGTCTGKSTDQGEGAMPVKSVVEEIQSEEKCGNQNAGKEKKGSEESLKLRRKPNTAHEHSGKPDGNNSAPRSIRPQNSAPRPGPAPAPAPAPAPTPTHIFSEIKQLKQLLQKQDARIAQLEASLRETEERKGAVNTSLPRESFSRMSTTESAVEPKSAPIAIAGSAQVENKIDSNPREAPGCSNLIQLQPPSATAVKSSPRRVLISRLVKEPAERLRAADSIKNDAPRSVPSAAILSAESALPLHKPELPFKAAVVGEAGISLIATANDSFEAPKDIAATQKKANESNHLEAIIDTPPIPITVQGAGTSAALVSGSPSQLPAISPAEAAVEEAENMRASISVNNQGTIPAVAVAITNVENNSNVAGVSSDVASVSANSISREKGNAISSTILLASSKDLPEPDQVQSPNTEKSLQRDAPVAINRSSSPLPHRPASPRPSPSSMPSPSAPARVYSNSIEPFVRPSAAQVQRAVRVTQQRSCGGNSPDPSGKGQHDAHPSLGAQYEQLLAFMEERNVSQGKLRSDPDVNGKVIQHRRLKERPSDSEHAEDRTETAKRSASAAIPSTLCRTFELLAPYLIPTQPKPASAPNSSPNRAHKHVKK